MDQIGPNGRKWAEVDQIGPNGQNGSKWNEWIEMDGLDQSGPELTKLDRGGLN